MSDGTESIVFTLIVATAITVSICALVFGGLSCDREREQTQRECMRNHPPLECHVISGSGAR